jgi:DNA-binding response OmpR family regulator
MTGHRFTLADDDADLLFLLHRKLSREYPESSIATFSNAADALAHIVDTGTEILITDHGMGEMSGAELIRQLRRRGFTFPIIMLSGSPDAQHEALSAGANEFLEKHTDIDIIWSHIKAAIARAARTTRSPT